jgi:ribonuclease BN (tRNA processing enzyme)
MVEMMWGKHTIPTGMFKVVIEDKVIIYAPDNELPHDDSVESRVFIEKFKAFIQGADVLIHDAQYNLEEYEQRTGWGHTNWEKLLEITSDSQIKQLYLTHHDPDNSDAQLEERCDQIQAEYGSAYELVTLARDEMVIELT